MKNTLAVIIALSTLAFAGNDTKPTSFKLAAPTAKLSLEDKQAYSQLDIEDLRATIDLNNSPQFKRAVAAHDAINRFNAAMYAKYGINPNDYVICEGPSAGPCADVTVGEIDFRKKPAPPVAEQAPTAEPKAKQ